MPGGTKPATEIYRTVLGTARSMFMTRLKSFTIMQDQMEKLMHTVAKKAGKTDPVGWKVVEAWFSAFRQGLADFQKTVEESFKRAEEYFDKTEEK